jgi:hypothetical protein
MVAIKAARMGCPTRGRSANRSIKKPSTTAPASARGKASQIENLNHPRKDKQKNPPNITISPTARFNIRVALYIRTILIAIREYNPPTIIPFKKNCKNRSKIYTSCQTTEM